MKRFNLSLALLFTLFLGLAIPGASLAARPNPPSIAGTVPAVLITPEPGGTNLVAVPPRVLVLDQRGKTAADVETTVTGLTGTFNIPLKKAGTYVVVAYYPEPNRLVGTPQLVEVLRKQTTIVSLVWPPQ